MQGKPKEIKLRAAFLPVKAEEAEETYTVNFEPYEGQCGTESVTVPKADDSQDFDFDKHAGIEPPGEVSQEKRDRAEQGICQVKHISFDILKKQKEEILKNQMEEMQENIEGAVREEGYKKIRQRSESHGTYTHGQVVKQYFAIYAYFEKISNCFSK